MFFGVLGPLQVRGADGEVPVPAAMHRGVLALLLAEANTVLARDALGAALWDGRMPATARTTLAAYVARLRQTLGPEIGARILTRPPGYVIEVAEHEYDVRQALAMERAARACAEHGDWAQVARTADAALALWRGEPFQDVPVAALRRDEGPALEALRLRLEELAIEARLGTGRTQEAVTALTGLVAAHPTREQYAARLVTALAGLGRRAEALGVYRQARAALREQLDLEPGSELEQAHRAVLDSASAAGSAASTAASGAPPAPAVPRQLPLAPRSFVGRADVLAAMSAAAGDADGAILALIGPGGIGKTATALAWARRAVARFPDGQLQADLRGFDPGGRPADPQDVLRGFLGALGVPAARLPRGTGELSALFRTLSADRRLLVLLDNAVDAAQVRGLLPAGPGCLTLVTSRDRLAGLVAAEGARPIVFAPLSAADSAALVTARLGAAAPASAELDELVGAGAGLPLALAVLAARLALEPELPAADLAARLRDDRIRLAELGGGAAENDLRAVFSWSVRRLTGRAAAVFTLLGLHPGPSLDARAAAALAALPRAETDAALAELVDAHLVEAGGDGRFRLHDLLRLYAAERAGADLSAGERRAALARVLDHCLAVGYAASAALAPTRRPIPETVPALPEGHPGFADAVSGRAWFQREREALFGLSALAAAEGFDEHAWQLPWTMNYALDGDRDWAGLKANAEQQIAVTRRLTDPYPLARMLCDAAYVHYRLGEFETATTLIDEARAVFGKLGDQAGLTRAERIAASVSEGRGDHADQLVHALRVLELARAGQDPLQIAQGLAGVAWAHLLLEEDAEAAAAGLEALEAHERIDYRTALGDIHDTVARAYERMGRLRDALEHYQRAADLFLVFENRYHQASGYARLARVHRALGEQRAAREFGEAARAVVADLGLDADDPVRAEVAALAGTPG